MTKPKEKHRRDSKTIDVKKYTRFTDRITVRMDPVTKKTLKEWTRKAGMSECHLIHALLTAYFVGVGSKLDLDVKKPVINLTVERVVKRVRRYGRKYVDVVEEDRWLCALKSYEYSWDQLPSLECPRCPNEKCRDYVLKRAAGA